MHRARLPVSFRLLLAGSLALLTYACGSGGSGRSSDNSGSASWGEARWGTDSWTAN